MPLLFIYVFGVAFRGSSGGDGRQSIPVVVEDERFLGEAFFRGLEDDHWAPYRVSREDTVFQDLENWIEIPESFTSDILAGERVELKVMEREGGSSRRREGYYWRAMNTSLRTLTHLHGISDSLVQSASDPVLAARFDSIASLPSPVSVTERTAKELKQLPSGFLLSVPGNLVMFVLMVALTGGAATVAVGASHGHLRRLGASPLTKLQVFVGKLLGTTLIALTQVAFLVVVSTFLFGMDWGDDPIALALLLILLSVVAASIGVFLGLRVRKPETAAAAGVLITLVMAALGGCWWPLEIVPDTMKKVGHIFPTAWAMDGIFQLTAYGGRFASIAPELLVLAGYGVLFAFLGSRLLRFDR